MPDIFEQFEEVGLIPVVAINDAEHAVPLARALKAGGLPVAEITFRTAAAEEAIRRIAAEEPDVLLGAGTVLTVDQVKKAVDAGAGYIVSPGLNPKVVGYCVDNGIPVTPGVCTPSDIAAALDFGLEVLKFFPAEISGGLAALKAMSAPYGMVRFIPTGGINAENLGAYLASPKVLACGGSWMVKSDLIAAGDFETITALTREAITAMLGFDLAHVGINAADAAESLTITKEIAGLFDLPVKEGNSSNFAGAIVEVNKKKGPGKHGHVAIRTTSLKRAVAYLGRRGIAIDEASYRGLAGKPPIAVYLEGEFGGFALHLLQRP